MASGPSPRLQKAIAALAVLLVLKVTVSVILGYRDYFPPNFQSNFLVGRESYFFGPYRWAFLVHILAGPVTLVLGLLLLSNRLRQRWPRWHRRLGKVQIMLVVCLLAPSGLWMARYAQSGAMAAAGFAVLSILTAGAALLGWRAAVERRFSDHRRWMWRCFLLLVSAVVVRVVGGFATVTGIGEPWIYPLTAWGSWLAPILVFELGRRLPHFHGLIDPATSSSLATKIMARRSAADVS